MAEDTEDFGDFTSAFPSTTSTKDANSMPSTTTGASQVNSDFFASFPPPSSTSGDQPLDFASFDAFGSHSTDVCLDGEGMSGFAQFDIANMNLDDELKLPSPLHDTNIHLAGGVAFDIPPLPDNFSDPGSPTVPPNQAQMQNDLFLTNLAMSESVPNRNGKSTGVDTSFPIPEPKPKPSEEEGKENAMDDSFGDFESSLSLKMDANNQPSTKISNNDINFGVFLENSTPAASMAENITNRSETLKQNHDRSGDSKPTEDFGEFGGFTTSSGVDKTHSSSFTNFESSTTAKSKDSVNREDTGMKESSKDIMNATHTSGEVFASFDHFQSSNTSKVKNQDSDTFGDFGAFSNSGTTNDEKDEFGNFGDFQTTTGSTANAPPLSSGITQALPPLDDFGAFADTMGKDDEEFGTFGDFQTTGSTLAVSQSTTTTTAQVVPPLDDFGAFTNTSSENDQEFGAFGDFQTPSVSTSSMPLSSAATSTVPQAVPPTSDDFGAFAGSTSKGDDEFGDFSSTSDSTFSSFTTSGSAPALMSSQGSARHKGVENVISDCFPGTGSSQDKQVPQPTTTKLASQLSPGNSSDSSGSEAPHSMSWGSLQKSIDFTIPLQKWDKSYMQECYFGALKMDPVLVTRAGVLPLFNGMGNFEAPLSGDTALDLLESFGFEGGLEALTQEPTSPTSTFPFRRRSSGSPGPALLDLGLPSSPKSPTNKDASFTLDADLLGLDLNPQSQSKQLTSIQELVLNERLVLNRSTWMDSQLLELGGEGNGASVETSSQSSSRPSTPHTGKKQNSIELQLLQLGLDASKTSLANSTNSHTELSLTARSTLGRLPDLSFMLEQEVLVKRTYVPVNSE